MKKNKAGKVLFSAFKTAVNAETLDELNGFTITVDGWRDPVNLAVDHDAKHIILHTNAMEIKDAETMHGAEIE